MEKTNMTTEEIEKNGLTYIVETITDTSTDEVISKVTKLKNTSAPKELEPPEQDIINAEILLSNAEILSKLKEQEEVQAQILLNSLGV